MVSKSNLKCYKNGVVEWVIAESPEGATREWCKQMGEDNRDYMDESDEEYWEEVSMDSVLRIYDDRDYPETGYKWQTVREWIEQCGAGYLCSTEY
jgi:hypothetical protein